METYTNVNRTVFGTQDLALNFQMQKSFGILSNQLLAGNFTWDPTFRSIRE